MHIPPIIFESFSPALLLAIRLGGMMTFAPFVGSTSIPWQVKSALTVALTALLTPAYMARIPAGAAILRPSAMGGLLHAGAGIFLMGLQMAAPALTVTLMADMALSFMAKASPQRSEER